MEANRPWWRHAPLALGASGVLLGFLALLDKVFGVVQRPLQLATAAYALLLVFLVWGCFRGIHLKQTRFMRISMFAGFLMLSVLTAAYIFTIRIVRADPYPLMLNARLMEGDELLKQGKKEDALLLYREAHSRFPNSFPVLMRIGAAHYQIGDYSRSERYFTRALEVALPESRWRALNDLGQTLWKLRRPQEAIQQYLQAREEGMPDSKPELIEWHYRLGWAYFDIRNYDSAIENYEAVALYGEKYAAASYYNIACALAQKLEESKVKAEQGQLSLDAVRNLEEAWKLTPEEERADFRTGLLGTKTEQDPELEPLRGTAPLSRLLAELRAGNI